jgi:uncharacterized protein
MKTLMLALLAGSLMLTPALTPAFAEETKIVRSISISGRGEVKAVPDVASIQMGVSSFAETARAALDANTASMTKLIETLKAAGIDARDVATSNFSINPRIQYPQDGVGAPKTTGYDVNNSVTVVVREVKKLGGVLDAAVTAGSNTINGISFSVSKPEAMLDEARKKAIADARRKAEIYAVAGGFTLGDIISVTEGGGYQPPPPVVTYAKAESAAGDVPIAQGEQALAIDVNVVWGMK